MSIDPLFWVQFDMESDEVSGLESQSRTSDWMDGAQSGHPFNTLTGTLSRPTYAWLSSPGTKWRL